MAGRIFTIGYSGFSSPDALGARLAEAGVQWVCDVRSLPYSRNRPWACRDALKAYLRFRGMGYAFLGTELGARQPDQAVQLPDGYLDFEAFSRTELFGSGLRRLQDGLAQGLSLALLCAEKEPMDCHRCLMIGRGLVLEHVPVLHLLPKGWKTQENVEDELLLRHFRSEFAPAPGGGVVDMRPMRDMIGLPSVADRIAEAYRRQNLELGRRTQAVREAQARVREAREDGMNPLP